MRGARNFLHRYRNYFLPADYRGYRQTVRQLKERAPPDSSRPSVLFEFTEPMIDKDLGRYAFNVVREFLDAGFTVYLAPHFWFLSSCYRKVFKRLLIEQPIHLLPEPATGLSKPLLLLTDRDSSAYRDRCVHVVRLDYRSRLHRDADIELIPYRQAPMFNTEPGMPPWPDLADEDRPIPVAFFGHWRHPDYDNTAKLTQFGAHGRRELIDALLGGLAAEQIFVAGRGSSPGTDGAGKFVLAEDSNLPKLPEYARALRQSNFFVCCPGTGYLLCHNMIESMLLGCIPILERPELSGLPLVPGENCLTFDTPAGLLEQVRRCLHGGAALAAEMRPRLREVVHQYLEPGSFARKIDPKNPPASLALFWFESA